MTTPTMPAEVVDNGDGTYAIHEGGPYHGTWTIHSTCEGWVATHPTDGWYGARFATPQDVACAILGDPAPCRLFDGRLYGEVYG
jgi:hypothetical protein